MPAEPETFQLGDFELDCGETLRAAFLAYTTYGRLDAAGGNAIVFPTWFVGTHADLEWLIGDGNALDTSRYFVVVPSMFANGLSSSPSNTPPPHDRARFPRVSIQDNVRAQHRLVTEHLGITKVQLAIGGSLGAFQAYQWALSHPDLVERMLASCGAARVARHTYVFLDGVRSALQADCEYRGGEYTERPERGLRAVGRVYAGWGFSQAWYRDELYRQIGFESVEDCLVGFWEAFFVDLDANDLLSQLATWQSADISATSGYDGDIERALGDIRAKAFVTPGHKDLYFPPEDMAWEAARMPHGAVREIPGVWGHLSETGLDPDCSEYLRGAIRELLASG